MGLLVEVQLPQQGLKAKAPLMLLLMIQLLKNIYFLFMMAIRLKVLAQLPLTLVVAP